MRLQLTILAILAIVASGCGPAAVPPASEAPAPAEDVAAIRANSANYEAAVNAGDVAALAGLHSDDAIRMPPNEAAVVGKEAIESWHQAGFDQFSTKLTVSPAEVDVADGWAYARGAYTITQTPKAGGEQRKDAGKYLVIYKRQPDGSWKVHRAIWNSDQPLPDSD